MDSREEMISEAAGAYAAAFRRGDETAARTVLSQVPDAALDEVLAHIEQLAVVPEVSYDVDGVQHALEHAGIAPDMASQLSVLTVGSFAEFVRQAMAANGLGVDTILERISADGAIDDQDAMIVNQYLTEVADQGRSDIELTPTHLHLISRLLGHQPGTIIAMRDR